MTLYDISFLKTNGYFNRQGTDTERVEGEDVTFKFDPDARLAYFEGVDSDWHQTIVSELRSVGRNFDFYWFWNEPEERVAVYNRYGEHKWFIFNQSIGLAADAHRSKETQLESIDEGLKTLFDIQAVVDQFYRNLWDIRLNIAREFETPNGVEISDSERIMAAQRTIDRLIFCYFLCKKDIIHGIDSAGNRFGLTPTKMFETVLDNGDFYAFLTDTFFNHLNTEGWTDYQVTDGVAITYPYLNGGLFRNHEIDTVDNNTITERDLVATDYDWTVLVDELNQYNWLIEEEPSEEAERTETNKLSPAVLGHIFEKFVITVSELEDEDELSLQELDEMDISASGEQMLEGNREVGAYYTPNYIAYENTRETLWNRVRTALADEHDDVNRTDIPDPDTFFEEMHSGDSPYPIGLSDVENVLGGITVLDPSAGSGAFLMTAGEVLETWRYKCTEDVDRYEIRREIIRRSLYGVDLLDGAVEVCKLRLWLWLTGTMTVDLDDDPSVETLPNIDFNIRQGNSLIGVAEPEYDSLIAHMEFNWTNGETKTYPEAVTDYRENIIEYQVASGAEASNLRKTIVTQRTILQEEFNEIFAQDSNVTVEEEVETYGEFSTVMDDITGKVKFNLDFNSAMTDLERQQVSDAGFREQKNWKTTAYHSDIRKASPDQVEAIFEMMVDRGKISIERPISPSDVAELDPFHWIFEFPMAYAPTGDDYQAFSVIIGNPPHGSSLGALQKSLLEEKYSLIEGGREVAKMFTERSWELTESELSYIIPKASTYNSNWEDFREYCFSKMYRGVDLGKAFRNVDHEQVTIHLDKVDQRQSYICGPLSEGTYHLDGAAEIPYTFAKRIGTIPVSFSSEQQAIAAELDQVEFPTMGELGIDAGRGAKTPTRETDSDGPISFNGKQIQRYFTRSTPYQINLNKVSDSAKQRVEQPKVMAQRIIAHVQNPYDHLSIAAVYDPVSSYNFVTVANITVPNELEWSLPSIAVLLNTQFVNWYMYFLIFNRAIRNMNLDGYFLRRLIAPNEVSEEENEILENIYGLLATTGASMEYNSVDGIKETHRELESLANALTYEMYLRDVSEPPLQTNLSEKMTSVFNNYNIDYLDWYSEHLKTDDETETSELLHSNQHLLETGQEVVDSLYTEDIIEELHKIAEHPWVQNIERGEHIRCEDEPPLFGPHKP